MKIRTAVFAIALGAALSSAGSAQVISYSPRTGDIRVDTQLGYMNDYGRRDRDYFVDDVVNNFGAPRYLVNDLLGARRWAPGDVYYACAMAYQLRRPCNEVAREYERDRGQGWGVIARRMGIKPGSAQFHALKGNVDKSNGKFKAHRSGARSSEVQGPGNSGKGKPDAGPGNSGNSGQGKPEAAPGNSGNAGKGEEKSKGGKP